jgi:hypothetical protein
VIPHPLRHPSHRLIRDGVAVGMLMIWDGWLPNNARVVCEASQDEPNDIFLDYGEVAEWPKAAVC